MILLEKPRYLNIMVSLLKEVNLGIITFKMKIPKVSAGVSAGGKFLLFFKALFVFGVIFFTLGSAIYQGIIQKDVNVFVNEIGENTFGEFLEARDSALLFSETNNYFNFFNMLFSIWQVFVWIYVFYFIGTFLRKGRDSPAEIFIGSLIVFIFLQAIYVALIGESLNVLWSGWVDIFKGITNVFNIEFNFFETSNDCVGEICQA